MNSVPNEVSILMKTSFHLNLFKDDSSYSRLFDDLMDKFEKQKVLFEYIYEQVKSNMFELKPVEYQGNEFLRLILLKSITEEFNNELQQELKCLDY